MPYARQVETPAMGNVTSDTPVASGDATIPDNAVAATAAVIGNSATPGTGDQVAIYWQLKTSTGAYVFPGDFLGVIDRYNEDDGSNNSGISEAIKLPQGGGAGRIMGRRITAGSLTANVAMTVEIAILTYTDPA